MPQIDFLSVGSKHLSEDFEMTWSWIAVVGLLVMIATGCGAQRVPLASGDKAPILLFNGSGASPGDVAALESILREKRLAYSTVNSSQLNEIDETQIRTHRLLIIPGGNFIDIGNGLTIDTSAKIRAAIQNGVNYLGICAGGFFAGDTGYNSLNLTSGVKFGFYSISSQGFRKAAVTISVVGGLTLDQYWEDGPQFTGWGAVIAKYPDGTPAVVEGSFGKGWIILTGVHPEATAAWRRGMKFTTSVSEDVEFASRLIQSALNGSSQIRD